MTYLELLRATDSFKKRNKVSLEKINDVKDKFAEHYKAHTDIFVFVGGSLGRGDVGEASDLDLFNIVNKKTKRY